MSTKPEVKPLHTIVRYRVSDPALYVGWRPITVVRFRFFEHATYKEVTGETGGIDWDQQWTCETLENGRWRINGRNDTWRTLEEALAALSLTSFATFGEAIASARQAAINKRDLYKRRASEAQWNINEIDKATAPNLPD